MCSYRESLWVLSGAPLRVRTNTGSVHALKSILLYDEKGLTRAMRDCESTPELNSRSFLIPETIPEFGFLKKEPFLFDLLQDVSVQGLADHWVLELAQYIYGLSRYCRLDLENKSPQTETKMYLLSYKSCLFTLFVT